VTATAHEADSFDVPYSASVIGPDTLHAGPDARSLPNALTREPGVMLQKTGPGQSSPYIRGFTGFRTLFLVDGIRLNDSTWREGPNQYSSTVDHLSVDHLELVRGPSSVLYGSDAIGGTVNALTIPASAEDGWSARWFSRWSSAERALFNRLEAEGGEAGEWALRVGVTDKRFGDVHAGGGIGNQPNTSFDERDADFRLDVPIEDGVDLTIAGQHVQQRDVPRTHKTVHAKPFHGTQAGTELERDLDQTRDLVYGRLGWDGDGGLYDRGEFTLSVQRKEEEQRRLRTGDRFDVTGFDVDTIGLQLQYEAATDIGLLTWGVEHYHDDVDSFSEDYVAGVLQGDTIQGPVADDARYDLSGVYVQDEIEHGPYETILGLRWTRAAADADKVDNPNVPGSDPATPGNVLSVDESWNAFVGSVRTTRHVSAETNVYGGLSQGFRAPNLSDLSSDLTDSGIETPTPDLDPEYYLQLELGAKTEQAGWRGDVAVYHTWIRDMVVQSPTGQLIDGVPVVTKDNVGDGALYGIEARGEVDLAPEWTLYASTGWLHGEVEQFTDAGLEATEPISRLMPWTGLLGVTWEPADIVWWLQADVLAADRADKLSFKDETDVERIPPGGTPGYAVFGVRAGRSLSARTNMTVGLENLFDRNYRIHGSGLNEPGRSLVLSLDVRF
jgi:hemoglobin/transferrin/lactoferrin receptor protein